MKQKRFLAKGVGGANVSAFFVVLPVAGYPTGLATNVRV